jgi:hypothetical protein
MALFFHFTHGDWGSFTLTLQVENDLRLKTGSPFKLREASQAGRSDAGAIKILEGQNW